MKKLNEIPQEQKRSNPLGMDWIELVLSTILFTMFILGIALYLFPIDTTLHW
tara:strand:- start:51 stop:206 length:156 start_codon:yes stop_codon:yes gene_type:complete